MVTKIRWSQVDYPAALDNVTGGLALPLPVQTGIAPLSGIDASGLVAVESSGAGTVKPVFYKLRFADAADNGRMWVFRIPSSYASTPKLSGSFVMSGANTDDEVVLQAQVAVVVESDGLVSAKVFGAVNTLTHTVPDTADELDAFLIPLTNDDGMVANALCFLSLWRDGDNVLDTATGYFDLLSLSLTYL